MAGASDGSVQGHDGGDDAVDLLGALLLVGFDVPGRVGADVDVVHHPRQDLVAPRAAGAPLRRVS